MNEYLKDVFDDEFIPQMLINQYVYTDGKNDSFSKILGIHMNENQLGFELQNKNSGEVTTKYFIKDLEYRSESLDEYVDIYAYKDEAKRLLSEDYVPKTFDELYESIRLYVILKKHQDYSRIELDYENLSDSHHDQIINFIFDMGYHYKASFTYHSDSQEEKKNYSVSKFIIFLK